MTDSPEPSPELSPDDAARGAKVRNLLRGAATAALATSMHEGGHPYASLALPGSDAAGRPLLLLSDLAVHSRNIKAAPEVSLLVAAPEGGHDPLTEARASLEGRLSIITDAAALARYLRRYPSAEDFAAFADFNLYSMEISRAHLVAGFGDIHWLPGNALILDPGFLEEEGVEQDILDHMNEDHADALGLLFGDGGRGKEGEAAAVRMSGIDREGIDLCRGWTYKRILFDSPVSNPAEVRNHLVRMVKNARN